jgi:hypothetical protein
MPDPLDPPANGSGNDPLDPLGGGGLLAALLPDLCDIDRDTLADDGQGTDAKTPVSVAMGVHCSLVKARLQKDAVLGGALLALTTWTLQVPLGTDLKPSDRVIKDGLTYNVIDTDKGLTNPIFLTATVERASK